MNLTIAHIRAILLNEVISPIEYGGIFMYEFECLTTRERNYDVANTTCRPFSGMCYPDVDGCCGPDCNPN